MMLLNRVSISGSDFCLTARAPGTVVCHRDDQEAITGVCQIVNHTK